MSGLLTTAASDRSLTSLSSEGLCVNRQLQATSVTATATERPVSPVELSSLEGYVVFPRSRFTMVGEFATFKGVSPFLLL